MLFNLFSLFVLGFVCFACTVLREREKRRGVREGAGWKPGSNKERSLPSTPAVFWTGRRRCTCWRKKRPQKKSSKKAAHKFGQFSARDGGGSSSSASRSRVAKNTSHFLSLEETHPQPKRGGFATDAFFCRLQCKKQGALVRRQSRRYFFVWLLESFKTVTQVFFSRGILSEVVIKTRGCGLKGHPSSMVFSDKALCMTHIRETKKEVSGSRKRARVAGKERKRATVSQPAANALVGRPRQRWWPGSSSRSYPTVGKTRRTRKRWFTPARITSDG